MKSFSKKSITCHTVEATLNVLHPVFEDRIISRRADVEATIWHRWTIICGGAVQNKFYADKPETIDFLKDNIREAIGEIQLHIYIHT